MVVWPVWRLVEACNRNGVRYQYSVKLPRLRDEYLDVAIYFYKSETDATAGSHTGGSGFLVWVPFDSYPTYPRGFAYAVTNRHVVDGGATVLRFNRSDGGAEPFVTSSDAWVRHPDGDDIAICHLGLDAQIVKFRHVPTHLMVSREVMERYEIGPGDDAFLVGRFMGHDGIQRNAPALRFGNVAMAPAPIRRSDGLDQESWLVETRSWPGISGSPVFVLDNPAHPRPKEKGAALDAKLHHWGPFLLGVVWCYLPTLPLKHQLYDRTGDTLTERDTVWMRENSGMAGVVPTWKLLELLDAEDLVAMRKEREAEWIKDHKQRTVGEPLLAGGTFTREQFLSDLTKVTRRIEPESDQAEGEK